MYDMALPTELERFSNLRDLSYNGGGEWSSACPVCGGGDGISDRLSLFDADARGNARIWCRQCGHFEWADSDKNENPDPVKIKEAAEMRVALLETENQRLRARIVQLKTDAYWRGYHDAMNEPHRALWRQAGIPDEFQDYWELGFIAEYQGNGFTSPAMTIPYFKAGREPFNVQYRLTSPPESGDKYRFTKGLKSGLWLSEPDEPPSGAVLLVEGAKKAAVSFIRLVAESSQKLCVVSVPSKMPGKETIEALGDCEPVYIALDPDAYEPAKNSKIIAAKRIGDMLGSRSRYVEFPAKIDDLFNDHGFTSQYAMNFINQATKAI